MTAKATKTKIETRLEYDLLRVLVRGNWNGAVTVGDFGSLLYNAGAPRRLKRLKQGQLLSLLDQLAAKGLAHCGLSWRARRREYGSVYQQRLWGEEWSAADGAVDAVAQYQRDVLGEVPEWPCGCGAMFASSVKRDHCFNCVVSSWAPYDWPARAGRILAMLKGGA